MSAAASDDAAADVQGYAYFANAVAVALPTTAPWLDENTTLLAKSALVVHLEKSTGTSIDL